MATALNTDINGLLALPNLADVLKYHVLGSSVKSSQITNGQIVQPLSSSNTLKLTLTSTGSVFVNQAQVTTADVTADNGVVHVLDNVVLPSKTVLDVAIDNNFTSLVAAVVKAELLPALSNPLTQFTVFAPTNAAFDSLAIALGTDLAGLLANPDLKNILLYHVTNGNLLAKDLTNGDLNMLSNTKAKIILDATTQVITINNIPIVLADVKADNGVAHVINKVMLPQTTSVTQVPVFEDLVQVYPNPAISTISGSYFSQGAYEIYSVTGAKVKTGSYVNSIEINELPQGMYIVRVINNSKQYTAKFIKQ